MTDKYSLYRHDVKLMITDWVTFNSPSDENRE